MHFKPPYTEDNIKKQYRQLAKKFHPDAGGDAVIMKYVNVEYEFLLMSLEQGMVPEPVRPDVNRKKRLSKKSSAYRRIIVEKEGKKIRSEMIVHVVNINPEKVYPILKELNRFIRNIRKK